MEESRKKPLLLKLLRLRVAIPLLILLALVSAPLVYRARQLSGLPDIGDPFDVEAFGTVSIPDEDNAFIEYRAAIKLLVPLSSGPNVDDEFYNAMDGDWNDASPTIRKWVADNLPALEIWRRGTEKPGVLYHQPRDVTLSTNLDDAQELREFSELANLEASRLIALGEMKAAWEWQRAILRSSRHIGMRGCMFERVVGISMHAMVVKRLVVWSADPRITAEQLREALRTIREEYKATVPMSENVKVEYLILQNELARLDISEMGKVESFLYYLKNEPEFSRRLLQHLFANALARVDKPRTVSGRTKSSGSMNLGLYESEAGTPAGAHQLTNEDLDDRTKNSLFVVMLLPTLRYLDEDIHREQTKQAALVVIIAAEIYKREQGTYPEKAKDLVGKYLDALPADPYGKAGDTMHYRRDENGIVVWGVGHNGVDDGGDLEHNGGDHFPDIGLRSGNYPKPAVPPTP